MHELHNKTKQKRIKFNQTEKVTERNNSLERTKSEIVLIKLNQQAKKLQTFLIEYIY